MIITILLGCLSVFFAYISRFKNTTWGLKVSFVLIFIFLALRFNFGNDYKAYYESFISINQSNSFGLFDSYNQFEIGWTFLNRLFEPVGFFSMVAFLAAIHCFVIYRFIKKYLPVKYYWFAVFLYIFNTGFLLVLSSAMRQSVAITLFIVAIEFIYKRKALLYYATIMLASLFHTSALFLLPLYFLTYINWRINVPYAFLILVIFSSLFIFRESLTMQINSLVQTHFDKYETYQTAGHIGTGLGVLFSSFLLILTITLSRYYKGENALIFKIAILSYLLIPLGLIIMMIGRLGFYLAPATLISYPLIFSKINNIILKRGLILSLVFINLYGFYQFFHSIVWKDAFGTYQTIFSVAELWSF